jgi:hypothetical protein
MNYADKQMHVFWTRMRDIVLYYNAADYHLPAGLCVMAFDIKVNANMWEGLSFNEGIQGELKRMIYGVDERIGSDKTAALQEWASARSGWVFPPNDWESRLMFLQLMVEATK